MLIRLYCNISQNINFIISMKMMMKKTNSKWNHMNKVRRKIYHILISFK